MGYDQFMLAIDKNADDFLYRQVIDLIVENIDSGTLRPGDRRMAFSVKPRSGTVDSIRKWRPPVS